MSVSTGNPRLASFWEEHAFSVDDAEYHWIDVVLAAMARGEWSAFERQLAEGLACAARAELEGTSPSGDELDAAATAFRYDRDLISAEEINDWLERVELAIDDWMAHLARDLLRQRWRESLDATLDRHPPSARQLDEAAFAEGVCSGLFDAFEKAFAGRAALVADAAAFANEVDPSSRVEEAAARLVRTHEPWLSARRPEDTRARLDRVLRIESRFDEVVADLVSHSPLAEIVDRHRLEWQRFELDTVRFATEQAAREAILCVTVDRLSLHDVAALSRRSAERRTCLQDEINPELRDRLLAIEPGGVLGPTAVNGHFEVTSLAQRGAPSLAEPRVAERARQAVIDTAIRRAARDHVTRSSRAAKP